MKKTLFSLLAIFCFQGVFSQVVLSSQHLDLKKSDTHHDILAAADAENSQFVAYAADKENVTALHYNSVLFFTDSLVTKRPDKEYDYMAGYSFTNDKASYVYWASEDLKKIQALGFNFSDKTVTASNIEIPFEGEKILNSFSGNNTFYIASLPASDDKVKLYVFNDGQYQEKVLDFESYTFVDDANKPTKLRDLLLTYPLQKMEGDALNPLVVAAGKIKLYLIRSAIVLTLDHNPAFTQVFTVDTNTYTINQKTIPQPLLKKMSTANSFFHHDKLYQIKLNEEELALLALDFKSGEILSSYTAAKKDTIAFKNSPLLTQTGSQRVKELKNTKQFLQKAADGDAAVSVYQTPNDLLVLAGGVRYVVPTGNVVLGIAAAGVLAYGGGYGGGMEELFDPQSLQSIYFEALFDGTFRHKDVRQEMLAADHIAQFTGTNKNISLESVTPYQGYYVLGYYDAKAKQYVLRKFQDDFVY
jgi:hypothetical protein